MQADDADRAQGSTTSPSLGSHKMTGASRKNSYKDKDTLSGTFEHLGECIEVIMAVYVPRKVQMRKATTIKGGHTISRHYEPSRLRSYQSDDLR